MAGMVLSYFLIFAQMGAEMNASWSVRLNSGVPLLLSCGTWSRLVHGWLIVVIVPMSCFRPLSIGQMRPTLSNNLLQATAMDLSVLTMIRSLIIVISSQARLPWLCLSFFR
jgi:hypothetical protein